MLVYQATTLFFKISGKHRKFNTLNKQPESTTFIFGKMLTLVVQKLACLYEIMYTIKLQRVIVRDSSDYAITHCKQNA